jgi:hypothetical protein
MLTLPASSPCRLAQRVKVPKSRRQDAPESHIPKALAEIRHVPPYEASQIVLQIEQIQREALPQRERADPQACQGREPGAFTKSGERERGIGSELWSETEMGRHKGGPRQIGLRGVGEQG